MGGMGSKWGKAISRYFEGLGDTKWNKMAPNLIIWRVWALGPKLSKIAPKLLVWSVWAAQARNDPKYYKNS